MRERVSLSTRGPEDFGCVLAALDVAEECVNCFCDSLGCPAHCPCS